MFSAEEEANIVAAVSALGDWSFPLTRSVGESRLLYRWPDIPDELLVKIPDVLCKLKGASVQKRGRKRNFDYEMEENCLDKTESMILSRIRSKGLPMSTELYFCNCLKKLLFLVSL